MKYLQLPIEVKQLVERVNWTGSEVAFRLSALLALASLIFILTIDFLWGLIKHSDLMVIISGNFCSVGRCHVLLGNQIGTTFDLKQRAFCAFLLFHLTLELRFQYEMENLLSCLLYLLPRYNVSPIVTNSGMA